MSSALVVSFDFELGWGVLDSPDWRAREAAGLYRDLRPILGRLFDRLHDWQCPTTWAAVASMFTENQAALELGHLPSNYRDAVRQFTHDAEPATRDARDLMDRWPELAEFSEVCSHTSTHLYPAVPGASGPSYAADVLASCEQLEAYFGSKIESLVLTRDDCKFLPDVLQARPLHVRVGPRNYGSRGSGKLGRIVRGAARFFEPVPASEFERLAQGGSTQSGSFYFNWSGGDFAAVKRAQVQIQAKRALRQLATTEQVVHVWLHPFNLAESPRHFASFVDFLGKAVELRDAGKTEILTMRGLAAREWGNSSSKRDAPSSES